jgi:hypothetical protein
MGRVRRVDVGGMVYQAKRVPDTLSALRMPYLRFYFTRLFILLENFRTSLRPTD